MTKKRQPTSSTPTPLTPAQSSPKISRKICLCPSYVSCGKRVHVAPRIWRKVTSTLKSWPRQLQVQGKCCTAWLGTRFLAAVATNNKGVCVCFTPSFSFSLFSLSLSLSLSLYFFLLFHFHFLSFLFLFLCIFSFTFSFFRFLLHFHFLFLFLSLFSLSLYFHFLFLSLSLTLSLSLSVTL